ncbi:hypothetical protein ACIBSW_26790 [Actinoplanes sp. NPDC049668]
MIEATVVAVGALLLPAVPVALVVSSFDDELFVFFGEVAALILGVAERL